MDHCNLACAEHQYCDTLGLLCNMHSPFAYTQESIEYCALGYSVTIPLATDQSIDSSTGHVNVSDVLPTSVSTGELRTTVSRT